MVGETRTFNSIHDYLQSIPNTSPNLEISEFLRSDDYIQAIRKWILYTKNDKVTPDYPRRRGPRDRPRDSSSCREYRDSRSSILNRCLGGAFAAMWDRRLLGGKAPGGDLSVFEVLKVVDERVLPAVLLVFV